MCLAKNVSMLLSRHAKKRFASSDMFSVTVKFKFLLSFTSLNLSIKIHTATDECKFWCLVILYSFKERISLVYVLEYIFFGGGVGCPTIFNSSHQL